eukprot:scaffold1096_cov154-Skeletonema_menzelii.AAC.1
MGENLSSLQAPSSSTAHTRALGTIYIPLFCCNPHSKRQSIDNQILVETLLVVLHQLGRCSWLVLP